jgi:hypothetical protein
VGDHIPWAVETSRDGERWRFFGKGWTLPGEPLLLHAVPRFVRFKRADENGSTWCEPLERAGEEPMTLLDLEQGLRRDLWPSSEHVGLPMLLPGGENGRLLAFEHAEDGSTWRYSLEFRGAREDG